MQMNNAHKSKSCMFEKEKELVDTELYPAGQIVEERDRGHTHTSSLHASEVVLLLTCIVHRESASTYTASVLYNPTNQ